MKQYADSSLAWKRYTEILEKLPKLQEDIYMSECYPDGVRTGTDILLRDEYHRLVREYISLEDTYHFTME